jgi:hypothetical protein
MSYCSLKSKDLGKMSYYKGLEFLCILKRNSWSQKNMPFITTVSYKQLKRYFKFLSHDDFSDIFGRHST